MKRRKREESVWDEIGFVTVFAVVFVVTLLLSGCAPDHPHSAEKEHPGIKSHPVPHHPVAAHPVEAHPAPKITSPVKAHPLVDCVNPREDYDALFHLAATRSAFWGDREAVAKRLAAVGCVESRYDNEAVSSVGAKCVMQFMPGTAKDYRVDVNDPKSCILGGGRLYAFQYKIWCPRHGRTEDQCWDLATAGGNWGQGNLLDLQKKHGCLNWQDCFREYSPEETVKHVDRINDLVSGDKW